jgi:LDH2 family malate/lactate/ureidoglycolate dehydrogenase
MDRRTDPEKLAQFSVSVLLAAGADSENAEATTWAMLHASIHGVDSHGIRLLPFYADSLTTGLVNSKPKLAISHPRRSAAMVEADGGFGHLPSYRAMDEACTLARETGIGMAVVRNSSHFGAAGAYALAAANAGFIGLATCNSGAFVVPYGGTKPIHGTNPIAFAAPSKNADPFLLDMATSSIPWNKVIRSRSEGLILPRGAALDAEGKYTTGPLEAVMLGPIGGEDFGYKGAALAGLAEILSGILTGLRLSTEQDGTLMGDKIVGHFFMAIDPTTFIAETLFDEKMKTYLASFAEQKPAMPAGGPQWLERDQRLAKGIPLPDGLYGELKAAAEKAGVDFPF